MFSDGNMSFEILLLHLRIMTTDIGILRRIMGDISNMVSSKLVQVLPQNQVVLVL
jgi:hypothetical protein